jgi:hypothetical protein
MTALPDATFDLPDGWQTIPVELLGAPGLVFVAAHSTPDAGFTANVTVGVQESAGPGFVAALGAEAVRRIEATEQDVDLRRRDLQGEEPAAALVQEVAFTTAVDGAPVGLTQTQAFVGATDATTGAAVVWTVTCTATAAQAAALSGDVEALVARLRAATAA